MGRPKKKDKIDKLKVEMDGLLEHFEGGFDDVGTGKEEVDKLKDTIETPESYIADVNFIELESDLEKQAKSLIDVLYKTYFNAGLIERDELLKKKKELDGMNLSNMLFQIKTIKMSISVIMQVIQKGNPHFKLIESFSDLQLKFSEITKNLANYIVFLETNYKNKQDELIENYKVVNQKEIDYKENAAITEKNDIYKDIEESENEKTDEDGVLVNDPKKLVDMVKSDRPVNLEDARNINRPLTDPTRKEELADKYDVKLDDVEDDANYDELNDAMF